MAFMLVALAVFFSMVGLIYFSIALNNLETRVTGLQDQESKELVRKLTGAPEFTFTAETDCSSCIDMDKAFFLATDSDYQDLWNLDYLMIEKIYPPATGDCTPGNYPNCKELLIIKKTEDFESVASAFVTIVRWDKQKEDYVFEFGRIHASVIQND